MACARGLRKSCGSSADNRALAKSAAILAAMAEPAKAVRSRLQEIRGLQRTMGQAIARAERIHYDDVVDALLKLKTIVARRASEERDLRRSLDRLMKPKSAAVRRKQKRAKQRPRTHRGLHLVQ